MSQRIYVEVRVRAAMAALWDATQDPVAHASWDLRFSAITLLPTPSGEPQRFRYENRTVPGAPLTGVGVSLGERHRPDGSCTSALRFRADSALSPIASGHGFWRYVPDGDEVRFFTGYDYEPGWQGEVGDRFLLRPVIGWMTAWSFDRLRLWLEHGIAPSVSLRRTLLAHAVRACAVTASLVLLDGPVALAAAAILFLVPAPVRMPRARRTLRRPPSGGSDTPPRISERVDEAALAVADRAAVRAAHTVAPPAVPEAAHAAPPSSDRKAPRP